MLKQKIKSNQITNNCFHCRHAALTKHAVGNWTCRCTNPKLIEDSPSELGYVRVVDGLGEECDYFEARR